VKRSRTSGVTRRRWRCRCIRDWTHRRPLRFGRPARRERHARRPHRILRQHARSP